MARVSIVSAVVLAISLTINGQTYSCTQVRAYARMLSGDKLKQIANMLTEEQLRQAKACLRRS